MTNHRADRFDRFEGFKAFFKSVTASNNAHLKIELYDDAEPSDGVQSVEAWRHCGHNDLLYFAIEPWKSDNGLVLDAKNATLVGDMLLAYADAVNEEEAAKQPEKEDAQP